MTLLAGASLSLLFSLNQYAAAEEKEKQPQELPLTELRAFADIFEKIKRDYVVPVEDKPLLTNAIRGMLTGLDPHSSYLEPEEYKDLREGTTGEFGGLGIEVTMDEGFVKVITPIDDTPAYKAGVKAGDLIIRLDDTPVKGLSLNEAVNTMRGKPGTSIVLTIMRGGVDQPLKITIVRDIIKVRSVRSRILEPGYGYVRITQFQSRTGENLQESLSKMEEETGGALKGLVLDLRNNPGGILNAAVSVSDAFLQEGTIVYTEGRIKDSQLKFTAKPTDMLNGAPIVVLVNGGSASASEIVAGALQDHNRAVIMGSKTFGKGSVQTILPMENGSALKLTTARYFTPSGRSIQAMGIEPDIILENVKVEVKSSKLVRLKEADLSRHLDNRGKGKDKEGEEAEKATPDAGEKKREKPSASRDYPLYEALNMLKGLAILKRAN